MHLDIRLIGTQPSRIVYELLSTKEVPAQKSAHQGEQHARECDLLAGRMAGSEHRTEAEISFYRQVMQEWCQLGGLFLSTGAADVLPKWNPIRTDHWRSIPRRMPDLILSQRQHQDQQETTNESQQQQQQQEGPNPTQNAIHKKA